MAQKQRQVELSETRQVSSLVQKHFAAQVGDHYRDDRQSFSQRAKSVQEACADSCKEEGADEVLERPLEGECLDNSSEIDLSDPDDNSSNDVGPVSAARSLIGTEDGVAYGFFEERDAIRIVKTEAGWRCVVEEDLGQMYFYTKRGYPVNTLSESSRTRVFREIAEWLNGLKDASVQDEDPLSGPRELLTKLEEGKVKSQKDFCKDNGIKRTAMSDVLKDVVLEWPFGALPLKSLFSSKAKREKKKA